MKLSHFFYLPRADRRALTWLFILFLIAGLFFAIHQNTQTISQKETPIAPTLTQYKAKRYVKDTTDLLNDLKPTIGQPFTFDPNTATAQQLQALGLSNWQIKNLFRYRQRGGVFSQPSDFARLYGLTQQQYKRLLPFIVIADDYKPATLLVQNETNLGAKSHNYSPKIKAGEHIDLNTADTTALKTIPGIGSFFAKEIVKYRTYLGGYIAVEQLKEIPDFPLAPLSFFVINKKAINKLAINKLSLFQLRKHPYINFYQAKAITDYRRLKGNITNAEELRQMKEFSDANIEQLLPYISFN